MVQHFRKINLPAGTPICLFNYNEDGVLGLNKRLLYGTVGKYVVLETPPESISYLGHAYDTAMLMTISEEDAPWNCRSFLMILCYDTSQWDVSDMTVFNYALWEDRFADSEMPVPYEVWEPKARQIACRAWLMVADPPSETLATLQKRFSKSDA